LPNYPWRIPNQLAAGIEQADRPMTYSKLAQVLDIIEQERSPRFDIRHLHCPSVAQVCLLGANAASAEVLVEQFCRFLEELAEVRSWPCLRQAMHAYVDQLVDLVRVDQRTRVECFVQRMLGHMKESLHNLKRLALYAELSHLSAGCFLRRFQEIFGLNYRQRLCQSFCWPEQQYDRLPVPPRLHATSG